MGEEEEQAGHFRFLGESEFNALDTKRKALYLVRAQQELEERQRVLRVQMQELARKVK